jgi:predicted RND superfamily exporter protein
MRPDTRLRMPPLAEVSDLAQYEGTPWLTGLANFCAAIGTFVGVYAVIGLLGYLHRGFSAYWPMVLILVVDVSVNAGVQFVRFRRRRAEGLTRAERRRRVREAQAEARRARMRR